MTPGHAFAGMDEVLFYRRPSFVAVCICGHRCNPSRTRGYAMIGISAHISARARAFNTR